MNEQQNEWKGGRREVGEETVAYLTPQICRYICYGKKYFKQNWLVHFISSLNQYCPISVLAPVSLTFINNTWWYAVFAIVYWVWILVHLTGRPFSIRRGQRLLLICISLSLQSSSMSFQTQAGWRSSSLFGIISVLRILHNPSWCSILLYHVTFFVDRGGPCSILPGSDVQASDSHPFCSADVDKYWVQFQSAEWSCICRGRVRGSLAISSTAVPLGTCGHLSQASERGLRITISVHSLEMALLCTRLVWEEPRFLKVGGFLLLTNTNFYHAY